MQRLRRHIGDLPIARARAATVPTGSAVAAGAETLMPLSVVPGISPARVPVRAALHLLNQIGGLVISWMPPMFTTPALYRNHPAKAALRY